MSHTVLGCPYTKGSCERPECQGRRRRCHAEKVEEALRRVLRHCTDTGATGESQFERDVIAANKVLQMGTAR